MAGVRSSADSIFTYSSKNFRSSPGSVPGREQLRLSLRSDPTLLATAFQRRPRSFRRAQPTRSRRWAATSCKGTQRCWSKLAPRMSPASIAIFPRATAFLKTLRSIWPSLLLCFRSLSDRSDRRVPVIVNTGRRRRWHRTGTYPYHKPPSKSAERSCSCHPT